jgi:carbon monoxide dehydrogenase subunit G
VELHNSFDLPVDADSAWQLLLDVPRMVPCLPGAKLIQDCGAGRCLGEVNVRLGPVMLKFIGSTQIVESDALARTAHLKADGRDEKGRGGAAADMRFTVRHAGTASQVSVATNVVLSGSVAQYGRGAAMIGDLANLLVSGFAENLRVELSRTLRSGTITIPQATEPLDGSKVARTLFWRSIRRLFSRLLRRRS